MNCSEQRPGATVLNIVSEVKEGGAVGRGHVEILHSDELAFSTLESPGWPAGAEIKVLSQDSDTGALTALVHLAPGFRRPAGHLPTQSEMFVIGGSVRIGEAVREWGWYEFSPPGLTQQAWVSEAGCTAVLMTRAEPEFIPQPGSDDDGAIRLDTERMPWAVSKVPGPPPGMVSKTLRHSDDTGERVFLSCAVPRYDYPFIEYHDCIEESLYLQGSMTIGTSGEMRAGSYFWRPPYITHGPFYSRTGKISLLTTDGPLINHYVDDPRRTPEENRAEAEAEGPPTDYFKGEPTPTDRNR